jgi:uncharacterized membrane protein
MSFRFYTNAISRVSRSVAAGIFILGLILIGFAFMIYLLPRFFATLAAVVFFIAGLGCGITAVKIFWAQRQFDKMTRDDSQGYRKNVQIHTEEHYD